MSFATEKNVTLSLSHSLSFEVVIQMHAISSDLCVYRIKRSVTGDVPLFLKDLAQDVVAEGVAKIKEIEKFQKGKIGRINSMANVCFATQNFLDSAQKMGYPYAAEKFMNELRPDVYTCIAEEGGSTNLLTVSDYGSHMLFTLDGLPRPTAIHCDYIESRMHNGKVELEKAMELLSNDPRVTFIDKRGNIAEPAVLDIPYYNVNNGHSQYLHFKFGPTFADMQVLWEKMKSYGKQHHPSTQRHRAMEDLDILGLAKAGLIKPELEEQDD